MTDNLIAQIYSAAAGRQSWDAALGTIARTCDAYAVQLLAIDKRRSSLTSSTALFSHVVGEPRPEDHLAYLRTYQHVDPRALLIVSPREQDWFHDHEVVSDAEVAASPFYQDFLIPAGARYLSAVPVYNDDAMGVMLCILRGVAKPPLEPELVQWVDGFRPHLAEAMKIYRHLSELHMKSVAGQAILDRLRHPVLLVDAGRRLRFANASGRAALASQLALRVVDDLLCCSDPADDQALSQALDSLVVAAPHVAMLERCFVRLRGTDWQQRFGASLSALRPAETGGAFGPLPLAMLVLHDGNTEAECDPFVLQELFGLTPAEANVGVLLSRGMTMEHIAAARCVAVSTVRSQLRTLMSKTGTKRQTDLVRRLLTLPHDFMAGGGAGTVPIAAGN